MRSIGEYASVLKTRGVKYCLIKVLDRITFKILNTLYRGNRLENVIVIESHNDFDCNGGAFFDYLIDHSINKKYKIVWLIKNKLSRVLPDNVFAFHYWDFSIKKNNYICRAKYLLCDDYFIQKQRKDQIAIYCTHGGVAFKNVIGIINVPTDIDYVLSPSENYDPYMCKKYSMEYPTDRMLHIGYPSDDILFHTGKEELKKVSLDIKGKCIVWMPTFRVTKTGRVDCKVNEPFGIPLIQNEEQLNALNEALRRNDVCLIVKLHPMQDLSEIKELGHYSNIIRLDGLKVKELNIDTYRLMAAADALISDYSSVAYSYILLNRPLGFVLSDFEEYKVGLYVSNYKDFMPGNLIYTFGELVDFIEAVALEKDQYNKERMNLLEWLYEYRDGNACERLAEFLKLK